MVVSFDLGENFILRLADYIEDNYIRKGKDISNLAVVFGGKRPALFLKKELAYRLKKGFVPPRFFSIDEFVEYILVKDGQLRWISDMDACFKIYSLVSSICPQILSQREAFAQFLPWAREVLAFIEQLDLEDIKNESLISIEGKAEIGYDVPGYINELLKRIVSIRQFLHKDLLDSHYYYRGLAYLMAAREIDPENFGEFEQILFCGFFYLHTTEKEIFKKFYSHQKATFVFQGDARQWSVLDELGRYFGFSIIPQKAASSKYNVSLFACPCMHSQMAVVRERLKKVKDYSRSVVLLPEPDNLIPLLSEIGEVTEEFNVSIGYPLKRSALYSLFSAIRQCQETKRDTAYYSRDYLKCLGHPLVKNLKLFEDTNVTRILIHKIEEVLLGMVETNLSGSVFVRLEEIEHCRQLYDLSLEMLKGMGLQLGYQELKEAVVLLHSVLFKSWQGIKNFYEFALRLEELLSLLLAKGTLGSYPLNLKMLERMSEVVVELKEASFRQEEFGQADIFEIFANKIENEMISFSGSPLRGLQVLGVFEVRSLHFDYCIIVDANESVLPRLKVFEPLIPREVMISLGINRLEKEEEIQRYHFRRLISSAQQVDIIYQEGPEKERSRFIEEFIWEQEKIQGRVGVLPVCKVGLKVKAIAKKASIEKTPKVLEYLKVHVFSASSINMYLDCPLKFYYCYVLGLEEKEELFDEPEAKDIGAFVHSLLEEVFLPFLNTTPQLDQRFKKDFWERLERKFEQDFSRKMKSDAFLLKQILRFNLESFLEFESQRQVKKILALEKVFKRKIRLGCGSFLFKVILDRIDLVSDKTIILLDYKTGGRDIFPETKPDKLRQALSSRRSLKEVVKSFQLPLYLYIVGTTPAFRGYQLDAALYFIKDASNKERLKKFFGDDLTFEARGQLMGLYLECLEALFKDMLDPQIPFLADDEDTFQCKVCPYFYLCR